MFGIYLNKTRRSKSELQHVSRGDVQSPSQDQCIQDLRYFVMFFILIIFNVFKSL